MRHQVHGDRGTLSVVDWRDHGEPVLFLHGLAGQAGEWNSAAISLPSFLRPIALDQRGHGLSQGRPDDVTPPAYVGDIKAVIDALCGAPVHLVGQSFGGHIAFLFAAAHPELVRSLVMVEASPSRPDSRSVAAVSDWLRAWPRPFRSLQQAAEFFGGPPRADAWINGLEDREGILWPRFDDDVLQAALRHLAARSWWDEWERVSCKTLVLLGDNGSVSTTDSDRMRTSGPRPEIQVVPAAGHDVHLDQPEAFGAALTSHFG